MMMMMMMMFQGPQGPQGRVGETGPKGPNVSDAHLIQSHNTHTVLDSYLTHTDVFAGACWEGRSARSSGPAGGAGEQ